jgi:beta-glucanase (GH16 family)
MPRCRRLPRHAFVLATLLVLASQSVAPAPTVAATPMYRLVFSEHFFGKALDATKWRSCYPWASPAGCSTWTNNELQWYQPSQIRVANGALRLVASREHTEGQTQDGAPKSFDWRSGMITTGGKFSFTYGKVVVRARIPAGRGFWPALWLLPADLSWPPEIDIMEAVGEAPSQVTLSYHESLSNSTSRTVPTANLSAGWHTFVVDWKPGSLTWSVDGSRRFQLSGPTTNKPMYFLANLAVGGTFARPPDATTPATAAFEIDKIEIWQESTATG